MNAPLPMNVTGQSPSKVYEKVARVSNEVAGELAKQLSVQTRGEVLFSAADRGRYATDASIYQAMPAGVFVPKDATDVRVAIDICRDLKVPIVPRGGGTSQCGQTVGAGLVIDNTKHMRRIIDIDLQNRTATVEPGLVLDHLNAALKPHGLWYPVDVSTSAQATLGGMAGNNSCGSRSIAYGNMVHNVLGAQAWLADSTLLDFGPYAQAQGRAKDIGDFVRALALQHEAEIEHHWPKVMRRVAGYNLDIFCNQNQRPYTTDGSVNLAHLLVGSEGTLAVTRSLTLQLTDVPKTKVLGVVNFPTFYKAMDAAQHIVKLGEGMQTGQLSAVELVDRTMIELSLQNLAFAPTIRTALSPLVNDGKPDAVLLVEFSGPDKALLAQKIKDLSELMADLGLPGSVVEMLDDAAQKNLWEVRKAGLNIMMSLRGDGKPVSFIEDCAVPLESLAEYTEALTGVFNKYGSRGTWYAHASVGTLHVRPILDMRRDGASKMRAIAEEASELVRKFKGAYSGEHGDGLCRGEWILWQFGPRINEAFAQIKQHFDPQTLLSPQRMIDPPKMDDTGLMRFSPNYKVVPIQPVLDWSAWDVQNDPVTEQTSAPGTGGDPAKGLAKAVEMCNNNGHCRKFDAGTMCPSYRVTRDEKHLTRGRANTLRLALSGQIEGLDGRDALTSEAVHDSMDLCVSCKGCKRDCPTGVDMAKLKIEFLQHYKAKHGHTLKDKLVAFMPEYAPWAARLAPVLNLRNHWPLLAAVTEKVLGFSAKRSLPTWQRQHAFNAPAAGLVSRQAVLEAEKGVVLFVDTFNGYFESGNVHAAVKVLQAAGYAVHIATKQQAGGHLCCGRTYLASGMVEQARQKAKEVVDTLLPFAHKGIAIVGLEPSCIFTLRDELLTMGLGNDAKTLSAQTLMFEEFLVRESKAGRLEALKTKLQPATQDIVLHGHCHQKAFDAVSPVMEVLRWIPGAQPSLIESSCCGMAGSFGYEASHYDVSMQMAELSLLPAIRAKPDAIVVADGTSCRHQIQDGAHRQAVHVGQLLASLLPD
jgi:FAD/FMN-containing dehydrogenase/Fe-S oxidoreductase